MSPLRVTDAAARQHRPGTDLSQQVVPGHGRNCRAVVRTAVRQRNADLEQQAQPEPSSSLEQPRQLHPAAADATEQQRQHQASHHQPQHQPETHPWLQPASGAYAWLKRRLRFHPSRRHDTEIAAIAVPALLSLAADPLLSLVDTAFVGRLGPAELVSLGCM